MIRQDGDAAARENFVGVRSGGSVGGFGDDAGLDGFGVVQGDDVFERRGHEDVALHGEQFIVGGARSAGHADDGAGAFLVAEGFQRIDAARIGDAAASVAEGDDLCFLFGEKARDGGAAMAESLNGDGSSAKRNLF